MRVRHPRRVVTSLALVILSALGAAPVLAQASKAGVVTAVQGQATLARPVVPQPIPLKFKDDLFVRDRIETKANAIVRALLGGKALVTIRELSVFTLTEEPGRAAVELTSGKLALGVARSLMRPGEVIEIRTPNAVAGIRGSLLVAEVRLVGGVPQTTFTALHVTLPIMVSPVGRPGVAVALNANQAVDVSGLAAAAVVGPVQNLSPAQARDATLATVAPKPAEQSGSSPLASEISTDKMAEAAQLATLIAPPPSGPATPSTSAPSLSFPPAPVDPGLASATPVQVLQAPSTTLGSLVVLTTPPPSTSSIGVNATAATAEAETISSTLETTAPTGSTGSISLTGTTAAPGPAGTPDTALLEATAPLLSLNPSGTLTTSVDAISLSGRANVSILGSDLVRLDANTLTVSSGALAKVTGQSNLTVVGNFVSLSNGATLNILSGPLLNVSGGSSVGISGALVSFGGTGGNGINVQNTLAPTGFLSGVPVFSSQGGTNGFTVTNQTPLVGLNSLGTIKINGTALPNGATASAGVTGSLIAIQGGGTVRIGR